MLSHTTIFAHGDPCAPALSRRLRKNRFTIALDGTAEQARREGWQPHMVMGDFDSATKGTLKYFERKGTVILPAPDQDYTDLEKAIAWCILRDAESIWIAQAQGSRVDHSFAALSFLKRFHSPERELVLFLEKETVRFLRDEKLTLAGKKGRRISLLPFPACRVKSKGLLYELESTDLELGRRESLSNQARTAKVSLNLEGEALLVEGT